MAVLGRRAEDIDEFIEKLEATGAFEDVVPSQQDRTDEGSTASRIESVYTGIGGAAAPETPSRRSRRRQPPPAQKPRRCASDAVSTDPRARSAG